MVLQQRKFITALLICTMMSLVFAPPKKSEAVVALFVVASVSSIIADAVIICIFSGVVLHKGACSSKEKGVGPISDPIKIHQCVKDFQGTPCDSSPNDCGTTNTGTWKCTADGSKTCTAAKPSNTVGTCSGGPANFCGVQGTGEQHCSGDCRRITAPPANNTCTDAQLPTDALTIWNKTTNLQIDPSTVHMGDIIEVRWNTGLNWPPSCTLTGPDINKILVGARDQTGSATVTVTGAYQYKLTCGTDSASINISSL